VIKVGIHEAKTRLSELLRKVLMGNHVIISKGGKPIAEIRPLREKKVERKGGLFRGELNIPDDFDRSSKEIESLFYGKKISD
jgi:prevent-host-death family protein